MDESIDGMGGQALVESGFRSRGLTQLFGDSLVGLPTDVALCINNAWSSNVGGHNLSTANLGMEYGGFNSYFEEGLKDSGGSSLFGAVGIALQSDANNSEDAFIARGGTKMKAFSSVSELKMTIENAIRPLTGANETMGMIKTFDAYATKDKEFRDRLGELAEMMGGALPDLEVAEQLADPIMKQARAIIASHKAGISKNFMMTVPHDDTNGGGDLTNPGGEKSLSPLQTTPLIGQAIVEMHKAIPNLIVVSCGDGGRGNNNNDQGPGMAFITGPSSLIRDTTLATVSDVSQVGQNFADIQLSDGSRAVSTQANWLATALRAAGISIDVPHVSEALVNG